MQVVENFVHKNVELHTDEKKGKQMPHLRALFRFSKIKCPSQTMLAFLSHTSLHMFRDRFCHVLFEVLRPSPVFCVPCMHHFHDFAYS